MALDADRFSNGVFMLEHGFKMEAESLLTKSISFVTETHVPQRLKQRSAWLD